MENTRKGIDRRTLIKGATAIGGAVWALPVIEAVSMSAAGAVSSPKTPLPGSLGAEYAPPPPGIVIPFVCGPLVDTGCLSNTAAAPAGGCAVSQSLEWNPTTGTLTIGILQGYHLAQGSAHAGTSCYPAVLATVAVVTTYSEFWAFSAGGASFNAELLIVPAPPV